MRICLALSVAFLVSSSSLFSQLNNSNWHFGNGIGMQIGSGGLSVESSSINTPSLVEPSAISDNLGNLVAYCDGEQVYNAAGNIVVNGIFSNAAIESLFIPDPGNEQRWYVVRTGAFGVDYSILDFEMNPDGEIVDALKEIVLFTEKSELICATFSGGGGYWLLTADNMEGGADIVHLNVYFIDPCGLSFVADYQEEWFWAGWNDTLDDVCISADCSMIAASFKGHYVCFMRFNNETGEVYDYIYDELDTGASFANITEIAFSPGGQFVYCLGDYNTIRRYDLTTWEMSAIAASAEVVENAMGNVWSDIKLAYDGKIYLHNTTDVQIDVLNFPDLSLEEIELQMGVLDLPNGMTTYFPNTPNLLCANTSDLAIQHQNVCFGDNTELWFTYPLEADSLFWNLGDPASGIDNFSTGNEVSHVYTDIGTFDLELTVYVDCTELVYTHQVTIYQQPVADLGEDQEFCAGQPLTLSSGDPGYAYQWSTNESTESIQANNEGWYWVEIANGTCEDVDSVYISVIPNVIVNASPDVFQCDDEPAQLTVTVENADDFVWSNGVESEVIYVNETGAYWVTASNSCFTAVDTVFASFINIPQILLPADDVGCEGDTIVLVPTYLQGSITWNTGDIGPELVVTESGVYSVSIDHFGCLRSDETEITLHPYVPLDHVKMPNVFSPTSDILNERFRPFLSYDPNKDICVAPTLNAEMSIYNRWGEELVSNACSWNGEINASDRVAEGVYYYFVFLESTCSESTETREITGNFSVLRTEK
jgi:hypothetical protein